MTPQEIEALFTGADGKFVFSRWGRPIAPIVIGVDDGTLPVINGAFEALAALAGHAMAETDPEFGSNCMMFLFRDWDELLAVPDLGRLVPDVAAQVARLKSADANQYRLLRFDQAGAISAAFVFLRMDEHLSDLPAEALALDQVTRIMLTWAEGALRKRPVLAVAGGTTILHPEISGLIRAAYDPVLPDTARDASHALRIFARQEHMT